MTANRKLTTHVLDTALGLPARGLAVTLYQVDESTRFEVASAVTNQDGRTDAPLLEGDAFGSGSYELLFDCGTYFRAVHQIKGDLLFLEQVPIRFGVAADVPHYHVPLLLSPFAYSTYRGS